MHSQPISLRKNTLFSFLSSATRLITNFLIFVGIARMFGAEVFGQFTTAHTFATLAIVFADFGIDTLLSIEIARSRKDPETVMRRYFLPKLLFAILASGGLLLVSLFFPLSDGSQVLMRVFSVFVFSSALMNFFVGLFKGMEQLHFETIVSSVANGVLLGSLPILWIMSADIIDVSVAFVLSRFLGVGFSVAFALRKLHVDWRKIARISNDFSWEMVILFGLRMICGNLLLQQDTVLLAILKGDEFVAGYQAVFKLVILALMLPDVINGALIPQMSRAYHNDTAKWNFLARLTSKSLFLVALPISMIFFVYARDILDLVYGTGAFPESETVLRLFSFTLLIRYSVEIYGIVLITAGKNLVKVKILMVATILNLVLNVFAIREFGMLGASVVSLVTNIGVGFGYVFASRNVRTLWTYGLRYALPMLATVGTAALLVLSHGVSPLYTFAPALLACTFVIYFVGYTPHERRAILALRGMLS